MMDEVMGIGLSFIRADGGTQARAGLDDNRVVEYMERMEAGDKFPAVKLCYDGESYWLWDGFHRAEARRRLQQQGILNGVIEAVVTSGTQRDARRKAAGANAEHGLPRTNEDKRRAVLIYLEDDEWKAYSDRKIADELKVSPTLVGKIRASLTVHVDGDVPQERKYTTKHGTESVMKVGNIGQSVRPSPLERGIEANVSYASVTVLQTDVFAWIRRKLDSLKNQIETLEEMKRDSRSVYWKILDDNLRNMNRVYRSGDLHQAVNNTVDGLKQQDSRRRLDSGELVEAVIAFALGYKDESGRTWQEIENPSHTNGTFWQSILSDFGQRGLVYNNQADLKFAIKQAYAQMHRDLQIVKDGGLPVTIVAGESVVSPVAAAVVGDGVKPRIPSFVLGHFAAADEAISRIAASFPRGRDDDFGKAVSIVNALRELREYVNQTYEVH